MSTPWERKFAAVKSTSEPDRIVVSVNGGWGLSIVYLTVEEAIEFSRMIVHAAAEVAGIKEEV